MIKGEGGVWEGRKGDKEWVGEGGGDKRRDWGNARERSDCGRGRRGHL